MIQIPKIGWQRIAHHPGNEKIALLVLGVWIVCPFDFTKLVLVHIPRICAILLTAVITIFSGELVRFPGFMISMGLAISLAIWYALFCDISPQIPESDISRYDNARLAINFFWIGILSIFNIDAGATTKLCSLKYSMNREISIVPSMIIILFHYVTGKNQPRHKCDDGQQTG